MADTIIQFDKVAKTFGDNTVYEELNLSIRKAKPSPLLAVRVSEKAYV